MTEELKYWLASIPYAGGVKIQSILSYAGSPEAAWKMKEEEFLQIKGIGDIMCGHIIYSRNTDKISKGLTDMKKKVSALYVRRMQNILKNCWHILTDHLHYLL